MNHHPLRLTIKAYLGYAAAQTKIFFVYPQQVWMRLLAHLVAFTISSFLWRAVYTNHAVIATLSFQQTLNYALFAQMLLWGISAEVVVTLSDYVRRGDILCELLRPLDFPLSQYVRALTRMFLSILVASPAVIFAVAFLGLQLPTNISVWIAFIVVLVLGQAVVFHFIWTVASAVFYTKDGWALSLVIFGVQQFFGGAMLPLEMMPKWLEGIARSLPFVQGLYLPAAVLSELVPLSATPVIIMQQIIWLIVLLLISRVMFKMTIRHITVQGG